MSDLDDFKAKNQPNGKVSKIKPYKNDILDLKSDGYSTNDIVLYLLQYKNIKISAQAVNNFLKKHREETENMLPQKIEKAGNHHTKPKNMEESPSVIAKRREDKGWVMPRKSLAELSQ